MRSFFAMLWNSDDPDAAEAARRIRSRLLVEPGHEASCLDAPGLFLADLSIDQATASIVPVECPQSHSGSAVIFGTFFKPALSGAGMARITTLDGLDAARMLDSGGRSLLTDGWGSYVGLVASGANMSITCDPTSSLPCYYTQQDGITLAFSHLERCPFIDTRQFTLNLGFLARLLAYDRLQTGETGFNEVRELLGGEGLFVTAGTCVTEQVWDPRTIAERPLRARPEEAAEMLRQTAQGVVASWSRLFDPVHVDLSGGFDSSALCGLLARVNGSQATIAVHQCLQSGDPPEAGYAREAAAHADMPYKGIQLDPARPVPPAGSHPLSARPHREFIGMDLSGPRAAADLPIADATFTGQGGDHLFLADKSPLGFCDFLTLEGINARTGEELLNAARLSGRSAWSVLATCLPRLVARSGQSDLARAIAARRAGSPDRSMTDLPSWMQDPAGLPPAKFNQACNLMHMVQVREQFDRPWTHNVVHPFISQPLVSLCLQIPAYMLTLGGENRGLARMAFKGLLPERIRRRMTKGTSTGYFMDYLLANHDTVIGALRGGALEKAGLIHPSDLDTLASKDLYKLAHTGRRLLVWYTIEAWLRAWNQHLGP